MKIYYNQVNPLQVGSFRFFKGKKNMLSPELQLEKKQNPREAHNHNSQAQGWLKTED